MGELTIYIHICIIYSLFTIIYREIETSVSTQSISSSFDHIQFVYLLKPVGEEEYMPRSSFLVVSEWTGGGRVVSREGGTSKQQ